MWLMRLDSEATAQSNSGRYELAHMPDSHSYAAKQQVSLLGPEHLHSIGTHTESCSPGSAEHAAVCTPDCTQVVQPGCRVPLM